MSNCNANHDQLRVDGHDICWSCYKDLRLPPIDRIAIAMERLVKLTEDAAKINRELQPVRMNRV